VLLLETAFHVLLGLVRLERDPVAGVDVADPGAALGPAVADHLHAVEPGESVVLDVYNLEDWNVGRIVVTWDRFPSFPALSWLRRSRTFRLSKIPVENPMPPMAFPTEKIPWYRRRVGAIARYGLSRRLTDEAPGRGTGGPPTGEE
jgi:hypothetical protein